MKGSFRRGLERLTGQGLLLRQIVTILSGTASAQLLTVASMVPLARLYSPQDFGLFAIIQSVVGMGTALGALRYDMAIVLPKTDLIARVLHKLASRSILIFSMLLSVVLLAASPLTSRVYNNDSFSIWLIASALATYLVAQVVNVQFWLNRRQNYRAIAGNRLIQAVSVAVFQIGFAFVIGGFQGLIAGLIAGQTITLILVYRRTPELRGRLPENSPTKWQVAKRYRKMPLINGPNALLDALKTAGINVLIGNIAVSGLGQFSLAYQMTKAPVSLLNGAVAQVLLQRLASTEPGGMAKLLLASFVRIFLFAAPVFSVFYFIAPGLFPFVFGEQWADTGRIAQALVPWLFMLTFTSPLSSIFVVAGKQEWALAYAAISTSVSLGFLAFTSLDLLTAVTWLALIMAALLVIWVGMALLVARNYDRRENIRNIEG